MAGNGARMLLRLAAMWVAVLVASDCPAGSGVLSFSRISLPVLHQDYFEWLDYHSDTVNQLAVIPAYDNPLILQFNGGPPTASALYPGGGMDALADLDSDGSPDLVTGGSNGIGVAFYDPAQPFQDFVSVPTEGETLQVAVADINEDGKQDLVACTSTSLYFSLGAGNRTFLPVQEIRAGVSYDRMLCLDVNSDGHQDIVIEDSDKLLTLVGDGSLHFRVASALPYKGGRWPWINPSFLRAADANGDGLPDLFLLCDGHPREVLYYLGSETGKFTGPYHLQADKEWGKLDSLALGDYNGDGKIDVAVANGSNELVIFQGNGTGTFDTGASFVKGFSIYNPSTLCTVRLNGDTKDDLLVLIPYDGSVDALLSQYKSPTSTGVDLGGWWSLVRRNYCHKIPGGQACDNVHHGRSFSAPFTLVNLGAQPARDVHVRFLLSNDEMLTSDDLIIGEWNVSTLNAGEQKTHLVRKRLNQDTENFRQILALVDPDNQISETDETDQLATTPIR